MSSSKAAKGIRTSKLIVKNCNENHLAEMYSGGSTFYDSTSDIAVTTLKRGNEVWVRVHGSWSSSYAIHCCFSTFTGFMLGYIDNTDIMIG